MLESESETNGLTMKLLGLARYCEGSRAIEIQAVIAKLPIAAYNERSAAEDEIARLRRENAALRHRLCIRDVATPSSEQRHPPSGLSHLTDTPRDNSPRALGSLGGRIDSSHIKAEGRLPLSSSASTTMARNLRLTPPPPQTHELIPPNAKRQRLDSVLTRRRPVCTGCFQVNGLCDGKVECDVCRARGYGCEYRECWDGLTCIDVGCTRIHPDQWDPIREPGRKVNQSRIGCGIRRGYREDD